MEKIVVRGGRRLMGRVRVEAAKNAVLPVLAACLLTPDRVRLAEVPAMTDVFTMTQLLVRMGVKVRTLEPGHLEVQADGEIRREAPYDLVRRMRASILVMGALLGRFGEARASLPGGCAIGNRPIDLHLKGFEALGATIALNRGYVEARAKRLIGARIYLDYPSHTATENIMMAAVLAEGTTFIENAAEEPEVVDLANFLNAMGARVSGAGTKLIRIDGVPELKGTEYECIPDRIEAGTFIVAVGLAGGEVLVENVILEHLKPVMAKLQETGMELTPREDGLLVRTPARPRAVDVKTLPYPGFPTDMQAPMMALMTVADGISVITESVFENRFLHVEELKRMGADIRIEGPSAIIRGVERLWGAPVRATDLRSGAALVLAGLAAEGETHVVGVPHIDRGYVNLVGKLRQLGADIARVEC